MALQGVRFPLLQFLNQTQLALQIQIFGDHYKLLCRVTTCYRNIISSPSLLRYSAVIFFTLVAPFPIRHPFPSSSILKDVSRFFFIM